METELKKTFTWEIDNLSEKNDIIRSDPFSSSDGCEWYLSVYPKGYGCCDDHLSLFLRVVNPKSLKTGWQREASFLFVLLNQSGNELFRSCDKRSKSSLFCYATPALGYTKTLPLAKLQEEGNKKIIIEVYIKVVKVVHQGKPIETLFYDGFPVPTSQVISVDEIFTEHPDIAVDFKPKNQELTKAYMNLLLSLIETLKKSPPSLSLTELSKAQKKLIVLTKAGFKLDWLKTKLEEVSLEKKKNSVSDGSLVLELEERVKNVELTLSHLQVEFDKERMRSSANLYSFEFIHFFFKRFFLSCFSISKY